MEALLLLLRQKPTRTYEEVINPHEAVYFTLVITHGYVRESYHVLGWRIERGTWTGSIDIDYYLLP